MTITPVSVYTGGLPDEGDLSTFNTRMESLLQYLVDDFGPEYLTSINDLNSVFFDAEGLIVGSVTSSAASASAASAARVLAEAALDSFDDRYLGVKATAPTVDNDGAALLIGALYFNSTSNVLMVNTPTGWQGISTASLAALGLTATAGQINPLGSAVRNAFLVGEAINLFAGASDFGNAAIYVASGSSNGVTATFLGTGRDGLGNLFVDYQVSGTASGSTSTIALIAASQARAPAISGATYTFSAMAMVVAGTPPGVANSGLRAEMSEQTAPSTTLSIVTETAQAPAAAAPIAITRTLTNPAANQVQVGLGIRTPVGTTVNYTIRIWNVQLDVGAARLAYRYLPATPAQARVAMGAMAAVGDYAPALENVTLGAATLFAHGLGADLSLYRVELECVTANLGYSVGDRVVLPDAAVFGHCVITCDATNISVRFAAAVNLPNKSTLTSAAITAANWRLRVRAWR